MNYRWYNFFVEGGYDRKTAADSTDISLLGERFNSEDERTEYWNQVKKAESQVEQIEQ
ncbi:hypothetical protein BGZ65_009546, partial [Modicella reniformis]